MKIALLDIKTGTKLGSKFTAMNMRNFSTLSRELNTDFIYSDEDANLRRTDYDCIIVGFTSNNSNLDAMLKFVKANKNAALIMIVGEYEQNNCIAAYYSERNYAQIRNYEGENRVIISKKYLKADYFLNINLLIVRNSNPITQKKYDCIYYGRWRPDRADAFKKYINGIYLSTSRKNMKFYKNTGCEPKAYIDTLNWTPGKETLNLFRYSLYIEDKYTHTHYNCLANRWYEAGICNNVILFDADCENTIRRSEIGQFWAQIQPYIVHNGEELQNKINELNADFEKHLAIQKSWRLAEPLLRQQMIERIKEIIAESVTRYRNEIEQ